LFTFNPITCATPVLCIVDTKLATFCPESALLISAHILSALTPDSPLACFLIACNVSLSQVGSANLPWKRK